MNPEKIHLVLFLSRATPLSRWDKMGILVRETAIYRKLASRIGGVSIITSGGMDELDYQVQLGNIRILYNRWRFSPNLYSLLAPLLHWSALRQATIYKTNQPDGSWTAIIAGILLRKPVLVRAGYMWAEFFRQDGGHGLKANLIDRLQALSFERANSVCLTTEAMRQHVIENYSVPPEKINVVPNYVDTDMFQPIPGAEVVSGRICYVGRLHPRKNLDMLIKAVAQIPDASLVLIGQGEQLEELNKIAQDRKAKVDFMGVLPNEQIPQEINRSEIFVLPSVSEGHPKSLIEAMACKSAVIGTDVEGIRNVITHEENGLICPPTVEGIRDALRRLLKNEELRIRLGEAARTTTVQKYSLDQIVERELLMLQQVQNG